MVKEGGSQIRRERKIDTVALNEAAVIKKFEAFIAKTARRYSKTVEDFEDLAQEGRIAALKAARSWREDSGARLETHCLRNIWWAIHGVAVKDKRAVAELAEMPADVIDDAASDPELATFAREVFDGLSAAQQKGVCKRFEGHDRGQPSKLYRSSCIAARMRAQA